MKTIFENFIGSIKDFIYAIGFFGEQISFLWCCFITITYSYVYFISFLIMFVINKFINHLLKQTIQHLRPSNSIKFLNNEIYFQKSNGMPSGHTQITTFNLMFAYFVSGKKLYETIVLLCIVIFQRYLFNNHTFLQLIAGVGLGGAIAYVSFIISKKIKQKIDLNKNKKHLAKQPPDNAN